MAWSCGNKAAQAPNPTAYSWPEAIQYRVDYVSEAQRDREPLVRFAETKTVRLMKRDAQYLGDYDSVLKTSQRPGDSLRLVPYLPEDTLSFYVRIDTHGKLQNVVLGCDPAVAACAEALPSTVLLELRRLIPRLPDWEAPAGGGWVDTIAFDDASRPRGTRGSIVTTYTGRRDTVVGARAYWLIGWRSIRRAFRPISGATPTLGAEQPIEESGVTLVDKQRLMPVYSAWAGAVPAPPEMRALGATASGYRGRAYLGGTYFDSLYGREMRP